MEQQEIQQLRSDPQAFFLKVTELAANTDVEKPFDAFLIDLFKVNIKDLFPWLLHLYTIAVQSVERSSFRHIDAGVGGASKEVVDNLQKENENNENILKAMMGLMIAYDALDLEEHK